MSAVTATTTTSPVTVVCSKAPPISRTVTKAPTSVGLAALCQHDVVLPPQLILRDRMWGLATMPQQQKLQSHMSSQAMLIIPLILLRESFLFQSWASHQFIMLYVGTCYGVCFLLSGSHVAVMFTNGDSTVGVCNATTL